MNEKVRGILLFVLGIVVILGVGLTVNSGATSKDITSTMAPMPTHMVIIITGFIFAVIIGILIYFNILNYHKPVK